jgi:dipeptidyl aminopeptidase/acylaminoacyl peptidase
MFKNIYRYKKSLITAVISSSLLLSACQFSSTVIKDNVINDISNQEAIERAQNYIDLEDLFDKSSIANVSVSPNGKWLAFLKQYNNAYNLFLVPKGDTVASAIALTQLSDAVDTFEWSSQPGEIFFSKDNQGNENSQIYKLNFNENDLSSAVNISRLTNNDKVNYGFSSQLKESPDTLIISANNNNSARVDLYHLNTKSKKLTTVLVNELNFAQYLTNKQGEVIVGNTLNNNNTMTLYTKIAGHWTALVNSKAGEMFNLLKLNETTKTAYISADIEGRDKKELILIDLNTGKLTTFHRDPEQESDLHDVVFDKSGQPLIVSYYGGRLRNYPITEEVSATFDKIKLKFGSDVDIEVKKIDQEQGVWTISVSYAKQAAQNFIYQIDKNQYVDLLNKAPKVSPDLLGERKSVYYQAKDGVTIQAYLTLPKNSQNNLPTIILPHGGPWTRDTWAYDGGYFNSIAFFFADRGYAVLQPNFRGSLGFGKKFTLLGERNWGTGTMQQDLTDGVDYLVKQGIADKNRVGIMGASYGGYAALSGATFTPDVYKAVISYVGPSSLITLMESFPAYYRPGLGAWFKAVGDPQIEADRKDMASRSPINFVDNITAPLMLIQGANDPRVTQIESDNIAKKMHKNSKEVEYILAKNEGHGFRNHDNKIASIMAMEAFFAKHLGGIDASYMNKPAKAHLATLKVDISQL